MGGRRDPELRALPAVHELAAQLDAPHTLAVRAARRAIDEQRAHLLGGDGKEVSLTDRARSHLASLSAPSLRRVINASGVIVHTNLGRAPLSESARAAVNGVAAGYSNLELDLITGRRGSRQDHIEALLTELTGAEAAMAVNNGAGAVLLAAAALAGPGRAIIVSRGQLVEIGGGFRIPEVIAQSRSVMIEVGTTNRTSVHDFERALSTAETPVGAVLRVHQSNFRTVGFVEEPSVEELCGLGVPVIDDIGSGALLPPDTLPVLREEPDLRASVAAGAALVCCSGDKLLGGPQAGLLVGTHTAVAAAGAHPLARALRIDKLSLAALEATLLLYRDPAQALIDTPVLRMLAVGEPELAERAERLRAAVGPAASVARTISRVGGGALPLTELEGPAVALDHTVAPEVVAERLRDHDPPVLVRVHEGRVLLDPRTLEESEIHAVAGAVRAALAG